MCWRDENTTSGRSATAFSNRRVRAGSVLPYLVGVGGQVYVSFRIPVKDTGALVIQVDDGLFVFIILEERLIRADHLGVLLEPVPDTLAQFDDALNSLGGQERVTKYLLRLLPDAVDAARPLNETNDGPGQVVVHNDVTVL